MRDSSSLSSVFVDDLETALSDQLLLDPPLIAASAIPLLAAYGSMVLSMNAHLNLTAHRDVDSFVSHHAVDALVAWKAIAAQTNQREWVDIGSGAGIPGIIWTIANPTIQMTLSESVEKKANFLRETCSQLNLPITVLNPTHEKIARHKWDLTARALGPLAKIIRIAKLYAVTGTSVLWALKGRLETIEEEMEELSPDLRCQCTILSLIDARLPGQRHLVRVVL